MKSWADLSGESLRVARAVWAWLLIGTLCERELLLLEELGAPMARAELARREALS